MSEALSASLPPKFTEQPVEFLHFWNPGLMSFRIRRDPAFRFAPGQFARIGLHDDAGQPIWRAYSIVSAPDEAFLEFFLVVLPGGQFSSRVAKLKLGDTMLVEKQPQGFLTADRFQTGRDLWLIATGTGLAPYLSMLRAGAIWQTFQHVVIVLSVREARDLAYLDELQAQAAHHHAGEAKLRIVTTLTRDQAPGLLQGRINALLENGALEQASGLMLDHQHSRFMLCGNPEMVETMRALLKARGFQMHRKLTPGHIIVENYW
ncbi:MAG: ferredoxin--NADP reductase [Betaproteobacteria bacterium]|nr:ferredoxin--NADP reductase [Betaproteobacteria bacterium]